jgi:hypothetical protein
MKLDPRKKMPEQKITVKYKNELMKYMMHMKRPQKSFVALARESMSLTHVLWEARSTSPG